MPEASYESALEYLVDSDSWASLLAYYRDGIDLDEQEDDAFAVLSRIPGFPAEPILRAEVPPQVVRIEPSHGSLTFYGGRMTLIAFRSVRAVDGGTICLRHTAGSGLKFVEHQYDCAIAIDSCALRHFEVTSDPHVTDDGGTIELTVQDAAMFQTWIGDDIHGSIDVWESVLVQFVNSSTKGLVGQLHTSPGICRDVVGLQLVGAAAGGTLADGGLPLAIEELDPTGGLVATGHKIDYRRSPFDSDLPFPLPRPSASDDVQP